MGCLEPCHTKWHANFISVLKHWYWSNVCYGDCQVEPSESNPYSRFNYLVSLLEGLGPGPDPSERRWLRTFSMNESSEPRGCLLSVLLTFKATDKLPRRNDGRTDDCLTDGWRWHGGKCFEDRGALLHEWQNGRERRDGERQCLPDFRHSHSRCWKDFGIKVAVIVQNG